MLTAVKTNSYLMIANLCEENILKNPRNLQCMAHTKFIQGEYPKEFKKSTMTSPFIQDNLLEYPEESTLDSHNCQCIYSTHLFCKGEFTRIS